jgi:DNA-binding NarL/FixJ family response regulator
MKILIAESMNTVRYGLIALLEEQSAVEIVGEAVDLKELLHCIQVDCPDMLLLSWELPGQPGEMSMRSIRLICPQVNIVVLSSQPEVAERALELGANHFISKVEPPQCLLDVIRNYVAGPSYSSSR